MLLADDNADMRDYVERAAGAGGHDVEAVANGRQALDAVRAGEPRRDLVLSDVMMPELDGFGAARRAARRPATSTCR